MSIPSASPVPAVVIGGGISGLACAYYLQQAGIHVRVLESGTHPGGVIATIEKNGFRFELGPQSFLSTDRLLKLIDSLGLKDQLVRADPKAPRYILSGGKLICAPLSPPALLTTSLFGPRTKWRIYSELAQTTHPPDHDESIASFVRRKFGEEMLDRVVAPFVSGVYAGDPERLSLRAAFPKLYEYEAAYGSVLRGVAKSKPPKGTPRAGLCAFRDGMETLPKALADHLGESFLPGACVTAIRRNNANGKPGFEVEFTREGQSDKLAASAIVIATPTAAAAQLLREISDQFPVAFARIEYAPVAVVAAGYRKEQIQHPVNGFGFLVPRAEHLRVLGTVFNSSLFPNRAPDGMECLTSFAGGATDPELLNMSDSEISETILGEVARVLRITGVPEITNVHRYERALPQYNIGHLQTVAELGRLASSVPGLFLAGNYLSGPSIGNCVDQACQTAEALRTCPASAGL